LAASNPENGRRQITEKRWKAMKRYGGVVELNEKDIPEYKRLHKEVWESVLKTIRDCNVRNYTIFLHRFPDGKYYLCYYLEYIGADYAADMAKMAADPQTQKWWVICKPMQQPLPGVSEEDWWARMEEVFHTD
jgi:L-rhamnose mutarotase